MQPGNFYQGNSIFQNLSNLFPQTKVSDASQTKPTIFSSVTTSLTKSIFGIPLWILIAIGVVFLIVGFLLVR
jgi:type VI protein secretion system component VasF